MVAMSRNTGLHQRLDHVMSALQEDYGLLDTVEVVTQQRSASQEHMKKSLARGVIYISDVP
eukprot:1080536-Lingulodinium_polyedra.AAC.1